MISTRRDFLRLGSALAALAGMGKGAFSERDPSIWRMGLGLNGFASGQGKYKKSYPLWEILDFASRDGFEGIELVEGWPHGDYPLSAEEGRIAALKGLYDRYGLRIFSIQNGAGGAFSPEDEVRRKWIETALERVRLARALGCAHLGFWPGGPLGDQTLDQAIDRLAESFRRVGDAATEAGLVAAFEIEPPFVFNTEEVLSRLLEKIDHPHFKTIYDPSHFDLMNGSTGKPHEMLARIGVENIGYVHFTDTDGTLRDGGTSKHLACGEGHIDIPASLKTLREGGFSGWIMIDAWEVPDPYLAATRGREAIQAGMR